MNILRECVDEMNKLWWFHYGRETMAGKYCKKFDFYVALDWDCQGCNECTESAR